MAKFPVDVPKAKVVKAFEALGFRIVREGNHISMVRESPDGTAHYAQSSNDKGFNVAHDTYTSRHIKR
jgi:hypothetical protein